MQKISTVAINNESDADLPGNHSPLRNVIKGCVCPACSGIAFPHEPQLFLEKFRYGSRRMNVRSGCSNTTSATAILRSLILKNIFSCLCL